MQLVELPHASDGRLFFGAKALSQAIISTAANHENPQGPDLVFLSFPAADAFWRLDCTLEEVINIIEGVN